MLCGQINGITAYTVMMTDLKCICSTKNKMLNCRWDVH